MKAETFGTTIETIPAGANTPTGHLCLEPLEIKDLATYKKNCDVLKLDLNDTKTTLKKCVDHGAPATAWWADPKIVIGGFAISVGVGALIGAAIAK